MGRLITIATLDDDVSVTPKVDLVEEPSAPSPGVPSVSSGQHYTAFSLRNASAGFVVFLVVIAASRLVVGGSTFPSSARIHAGDWAEKITGWVTVHLASFYQPIADSLAAVLDQVLQFLQAVPAPTVALVLVAIVYCRAGVRLAGLTVIALLWVIAVGVWVETLQTLAFMSVAVVISSLIGVSVGIVASWNKWLDIGVRTLIDGLQAFPYFAYLVLVVVVFGPGDAAALVVTIIWAFPPIARMTIVGIRGVSPDIVEAANSVGATPLQVLRQVRLPLALPSILSGLNQTIMYAVSMATISALIGGTGLGQPVWSGLTRLEFGQALGPGIALVLLAVIMDRASKVSINGTRSVARKVADVPAVSILARLESFKRAHPRIVGSAAVVVPFALVAGAIPGLAFADFASPPSFMQITLRDPVNSVVNWVNEHLGTVLDSITDAVQSHALNPLINVLEWLPWPAVLMLGFLVGYLSLRGVGGALVAAAIGLIGALGMWEPAIHTIAVVGVAVAISLAIGFPVGVLMSRSDRVAALARPVLDLMQTMPIFLFVIPTIVFLGAGPVAGTLATVAYAITPMIRLTDSALREADPDVIEAAQSVGATERQLLFGVRVPLGMPTIMVGINQTILLALAMAVVSAFIGTPGLGEEVLAGVTQAQLGRGVEAGLAMFLLAMIVDRILRGFARRVGVVNPTNAT